MKTTAKKTTKNGSHKAKRAVVDELRWALQYPEGHLVIWGLGRSRASLAGFKEPGDVIIRVRITEVTK